MKRFLWLGLALLLAGCSVIEQRPDEVQRKLSDPTRGQLYVPEPVTGDLH